MTDVQANAGSVDAGNPAPAAAPVAVSGSPATGATDWLTGLQDEGNRKAVESKGWKSADDAVRSYTELEKRFSETSAKAVTIPGENATPEEIAAFNKRMGVPDTVDGYQFTMPEGLPPDLPYDNETAKSFKEFAHKQGIPPKMAQAIHDWAAQNTAGGMKAQAEATAALHAAQEDAATKALSVDWGQPGTEAFKAHADHAYRAIDAFGGDAFEKSLIESGVLSKDKGAIRNPYIARLLAFTGEHLLKEDGFVTGGNAPAGSNPYAFGTENMTQQMAIWKRDPSKARALIAAAGKQPSDFGLT